MLRMTLALVPCHANALVATVRRLPALLISGAVARSTRRRPAAAEPPSTEAMCGDTQRRCRTGTAGLHFRRERVSRVRGPETGGAVGREKPTAKCSHLRRARATGRLEAAPAFQPLERRGLVFGFVFIHDADPAKGGGEDGNDIQKRTAHRARYGPAWAWMPEC